MLEENTLQSIEPMVSSVVYDAFTTIEETFQELSYSAHELTLANVLNNDNQSVIGKVTDVMDIFKEHSEIVLNKLGITVNHAEHKSVSFYAELLEGLDTLIDIENRETLISIYQGADSGHGFIVKAMEEFTERPLGYWLVNIEDFDLSSIMELQMSFDEPLSDKLKEAIAEKKTQIKALAEQTGKEALNVTRSYVTGREAGNEIGFSFQLAVRANWTILDGLITTEPPERIAAELLGLCITSSLAPNRFKDEIEGALVDMDVDILLRAKILTAYENLVRKADFL